MSAAPQDLSGRTSLTPSSGAAAGGRVAPPPRPLVSEPVERRRRRLMAAVVLAMTSTLLGIAAWLTPDPSGVGTHLQLRMAPCGWTTGLGLPCPTCGMTTAFAAAADGNVLMSLKAQPLGFLLALATAVTAIVSAWVVVTGSAVGGHYLRMLGPRTGWIVLFLALGAWVYKIAAFKGAFG